MDETMTLTPIPNYPAPVVWAGMYDGAQAEDDWLSQENDFFDPDMLAGGHDVF